MEDKKREPYVYPYSEKSEFDPAIRSAHREMFEMTCRIYNAVINDQANRLPQRIGRQEE
jgi:hypothetical protein